MHSILQNAGTVEINPFPHVVIEDALDFYDDFAKTRPPWSWVLDGRTAQPNHRYDMSAVRALGREDTPALWREFIYYHVGKTFWHGIWDLFGDWVSEIYGDAIGYDARTTIRHGNKDADIGLDCQIGGNHATPISGSVRGPHVDNPVELFAGMLYMPMGDEDAGGHLEIHRLTGEAVFEGKAELKPGLSECVKTVPYKANTAVFFINTPQSIHAVSPRAPCDKPRLLVNFCGDMIGKQLFDLRRT